MRERERDAREFVPVDSALFYDLPEAKEAEGLRLLEDKQRSEKFKLQHLRKVSSSSRKVLEISARKTNGLE